MNFPEKIKAYIRGKSYVNDRIGMSDAGIYLFEDMVLKVQKADTEAENESKMLGWLNGKIAVPNLIEQISENGYSYILMEKCPGKMACDPHFMGKPRFLTQLLAESLQMLWDVDIRGCPCEWSLERRLAVAEQNVAQNLVDVDDAQPDTFGPGGFRDPEHLLQWLKENQPDQSKTLSHGDFCLPNVFLSDKGLEGFIDLGKAGIADPWQDIALCVRSLDNNYSGKYSGKKLEGFNRQMLFDALGFSPDWDRIRYYILLDELF